MDAPIILWDIDGTLLRAPGTGVSAFRQSIRAHTGKELGRGPYDLGGRTDPDIGRTLLEAIGHGGDDSLLAAVLAGVIEAYASLDGELRASLVIMPGVPAMISALADLGAHQSVLTGNLRAVAERKLAAGGLDGQLHVDSGAYGSDHADRAVLAGLAITRSADALGRSVDPGSVWVVGDTPRDLACARAVGARCALVATGTYAHDALAGLGADAVFDDLADTATVLAALTVLAAR